MRDKLKSVKTPRINWYNLIYLTGDQALIDLFWKRYNCSKVKSKKRIARCCLISYYSTITAPDFVKRALSFYNDVRLVNVKVDYDG